MNRGEITGRAGERILWAEIAGREVDVTHGVIVGALVATRRGKRSGR